MSQGIAIPLIVLLGAALIGFELCRFRLPRIVLARLLHGIGVALETRPLLFSCLSVWFRVRLAVLRRALACKPLALAEALIPVADACPAILAWPIRKAINGLTQFAVRRAGKIGMDAERMRKDSE